MAFKAFEKKEPKKEEKREAKMPPWMMKKAEAKEGKHAKGGMIKKAGKKGC